MPDRKVIKNETLINAELHAVWAYVSDEAQLTELCRTSLGIRILPEDADTNPYKPEAQKYVFRARLTHNDILLTAAGCSYAMRFVSAGEASRAIVAVSFDETAFVHPSEVQLTQFLTQLKEHVEASAAMSLYVAQAENAVDLPETERLQDKRDDTTLPQQTVDLMQHDAEVQGLREKAGKSRKNGRKKGIVIVIALLVLGALAASYFLVPQVRQWLEPEAEPQVGYSSGVTFASAMSIQPGDSRAVVEAAFGTAGIEGSQRDSSVYRGGDMLEDERFSVQVCVRYSGAVVERVTYLDLRSATTVNGDYNTGFNVRTDMSFAEVEQGVGSAVAMARKYKAGDDVVTELHFGYTDPFANFDPAWRGELVYEIISAKDTVNKKTWLSYDGADPLMIAALDGHPVQNQYSSYSDFLNDKYRYDQALYMLNRFSRGDAAAVYGELTFYEEASGVSLYYHDSGDKLPDSDDPVYRYAFGFDSKGYFLMSSFSNMRLFDQEGMLADSDFKGITRGMAYNEIRQIMRLIPTALFVDKNYFTLCYGKRLDSDVFEQQFEFMVRFDIENNYAQFVWDNTTAPPQNEA